MCVYSISTPSLSLIGATTEIYYRTEKKPKLTSTHILGYVCVCLLMCLVFSTNISESINEF